VRFFGRRCLENRPADQTTWRCDGEARLRLNSRDNRGCAARREHVNEIGSGAWTRTRITSSKGWRATDCTTPELSDYTGFILLCSRHLWVKRVNHVWQHRHLRLEKGFTQMHVSPNH
jgi:hypothetical protein